MAEIQKRKWRPWAWVILMGAGLAFAINGGVKRSFTLIYPEILVKYATNNFAASWTISIFGGVKMFSGPFVSYMCLRFGHSKVTIAGGILACAGMVSSAYAPQLPVLYVTYGFILAIGTCMMYIPSVALIGQTFSKKRGLAMAAMTSSSAVGGLLFTPLTTWLLAEFGYSGTMLVCGGLFLHFCLSGALYAVSLNRMKTAKDAASAEIENEVFAVRDALPAQEEIDSLPESNTTDTTGLPQSEVTNLERLHYTRHVTPKSHLPVLRQVSFDITKKKKGGLPLEKKPSYEPNVQRIGGLDNMSITKDSCLKSFVLKIKKFCQPKGESSNFKASCISLGKAPVFMIFASQMAGYMYCVTTDSVFLSSLAQEKGFSAESITVLLVILSAIGIPSRLFSAVGDLSCIKTRIVSIHALLGVIMGVAAILLGFLDNQVSLYICWIILQVGQNICHAQQANVLAEVVDASTYTCALGVMRFISGIGAVLSPPVSGFIGDTSGYHMFSYIVSGAVCLATSVILLVFFQIRRRNQARSHSLVRRVRSHSPPPVDLTGIRVMSDSPPMCGCNHTDCQDSSRGIFVIRRGQSMIEQVGPVDM